MANAIPTPIPPPCRGAFATLGTAALGLAALGLAASASPARAAGPSATDDGIAPWLRDAALSPDGTRVAFRGAGQIWVVPAAGGDALPLTPAGTYAGHPVWSPDGATIAFASDRFGPLNVFAVPAAGGAARRLTWNERDQGPTGFTPDGTAVLFWSAGLGDARQTGPIPSAHEDGRQLYSVPVTGGREEMVLPNAAMEASWDPAGRRLAYTGPSPEQPFRRRQASSAARQVWVYDAAGGAHRRLADGPHETRSPVWMVDGGLDYLDESSGTLNVWHRDPGLAHPVQVTHLAGEPVRSLSASRGGDIAFTWDGGLYRMRAGAAEPERIDVRLVRTDFPGEQAERSSALTDFAVSPDGREYAVVSRGEISVASVDGRFARRLPRTPGEERDPTFSADGRRIAYAAERDGRWDLYETSIADPAEHLFSQSTRLDERRLTAGGGDHQQPLYAPDGRHIAYVADRSSVRVLDAAGGAEVEAVPPGRMYGNGEGAWPMSWSPDARWLAVALQPSLKTGNVALVPADGSRPPVLVEPAAAYQWDPEWSPDGGILSFVGNGDALRQAWGDRWAAELRGAFTSRAARDAFARRLMVPVVGEQQAAPAQRGDTQRDAQRGDAQRGDAQRGDARDAAAAREAQGRGPLRVEAEGIDERVRSLSQGAAQTVFGAVMADGVSVLTVEVGPNQRGDGSALTGTLRDLREGRRRVLFSALPYQGGSPVRMGRDRRHLYFLARGDASEAGTDGLTEVDLARGTPRLIHISVDATRDEAEARRAAFDHLWSLTAAMFYDPAFRGVDWPAARAHYARFLPSVGGARDLAELISEMAGELGASHTGSHYRQPVPRGERTASLGLYYDERHPGPGAKVAAVIPGGPFDTGDSALRPGDVILSVDGEPVPEAGGIRRALAGRVGQFVGVGAAHPDGTRFAETRVAVSLDRERALADRSWVLRARDRVAALSCGRLGYLHLAAMDAASYRAAFDDLFGRFADRAGVVVDVRDNGGGDLHNQLITLLSGQSYGGAAPARGGPVLDEPRDRWTKPSAVVMNAASYSDSSLFPLAYRDLHLGPLVGDPVAGTGTSTWWVQSRLIPGLDYGLPSLPFHGRDGTLSENHQVEPDILVPSDPAAWAAGRDPQLEAAVRALMSGAGACPPPPAQP